VSIGSEEVLQRDEATGSPFPQGLGADRSGGAIRFCLGEAVLGFHVIGCSDGNGAQRDHLRAHNDADILALGGAPHPMPQLGPGLGNRERLHGDTFASLKCLSRPGWRTSITAST
jgi:hypothetical protein